MCQFLLWEKIWENWENLFFHKIRTLECHANGHPKPKIKWLREDKGNFTVYDRNNKRMIGKHVRAGIKRDSTVPSYMKCIKTMNYRVWGARTTTEREVLPVGWVVKVAFFQKVWFVFQISKSPKEMLQITILSLKFE